MNYTVLQLRGGTSSEHLSGNGTGFVGKAKEITVDTTEWTLRVHDGEKIGGHKLALANEDIKAKDLVLWLKSNKKDPWGVACQRQ